MTLVILFLASLWAGAQNALAGGGSFITLPSLMLTGMDARAANITSTIALFPAQVATGWTGRKWVAGTGGVSFRALVIISLVGGALGALLLLSTPPAFFARLVPWLVLFATAVFAWGSFAKRADGARQIGRRGTLVTQFCISIYGGYFGGGIGFLMLAALTAAGHVIRNAGATKNVLAGVMNASAVAIFIFSPEVRWLAAAVTSGGAIIGGVLGALMLNRINERLLRIAIVVIGTALTVGLFIRAG
ncbi:MAG TPA: sulfite exporter TauE/SafE family protein [Steroidobacteraceae bacterium]|nr:sulfite exporter TauE/SafE family protein [Steroidobacteraceae bacterium]